MAELYADEQFPRKVVELLKLKGYDIITVQDAGKANQKIPDIEVLEFALANNRAVITINRVDFIRLHRLNPNHCGIIICTENADLNQLAQIIHHALANLVTLKGQLIRITRPNRNQENK